MKEIGNNIAKNINKLILRPRRPVLQVYQGVYCCETKPWSKQFTENIFTICKQKRRLHLGTRKILKVKVILDGGDNNE